jgi:hypothetical protein
MFFRMNLRVMDIIANHLWDMCRVSGERFRINDDSRSPAETQIRLFHRRIRVVFPHVD